MQNRTCPKCTQTMHQPRWSEADDLLHYGCPCGYKDTIRPADAKPETVVERLAKLGITWPKGAGHGTR